jgi:hypothetical protein
VFEVVDDDEGKETNEDDGFDEDGDDDKKASLYEVHAASALLAPFASDFISWILQIPLFNSFNICTLQRPAISSVTSQCRPC